MDKKNKSGYLEINDQRIYYDGWLLNTLDDVKNGRLGEDNDCLIIIDGKVGCLSGDTVIRTNRASLGRRHTLKWMYNQLHGNPDHLTKINNKWNLSIPTFVRSFDGHQIRLHKILDVVYSGKKTVHQLELVDGKKLKCTNDHKIMTQNGFKTYAQLDPTKDSIMCDTPTTSKSILKGYKITDATVNHLNYHPFVKLTRGGHKRAEVHRIIYEAKLNHLSFDEYVKILVNDKEKSKTLKYVDINKFCVHHIDGNHFNNLPENLTVLTYDEHAAIHGKNAERHFNQGVPLFVKIKNKKFVGTENTYDIICDEPYHNFNANGMIVHNSGKSTLAQQIAYYLDPTFDLNRVCFESDDFMKKIYECKKKQAVIFDEATGGLEIKRTMSSMVIELKHYLLEVRGLNLFIILVLPSIFDMEKSVAIERATCLITTVLDKKGKKGIFRFFGEGKKNNLLANDKCRKSRSHKSAHSFWGRFKGGYVVDDAAYRLKKKNMLQRFFNKNKSATDCYHPTVVTNQELFLKEGEEYYNMLKSGKTYDDIMAMGVSRMTISHRLNLYKKQLYLSKGYIGVTNTSPPVGVSRG